MINAMLGIKKGMTSTYDSRGRRVGATVVELGPNYVTQVKQADGPDGYSAIQLGFSTKKSVKKPQIGHLKRAGIENKLRWLREIRVQNTGDSEQLAELKPGQEIKIGQVFSVGDAVKVTGVSKGRGFAGVVKRHGFAGGPKTHGQSDRHRAPGSIGAGTTPGRVYKGKRMAGHMGTATVSYRGLEVVAIDDGTSSITLKGGVPGAIGSLVTVENIGKIRGYISPPEEKPEEEESSAVSDQSSDSQEETEKAREVSKEVAESTEQVEKGEDNATS